MITLPMSAFGQPPTGLHRQPLAHLRPAAFRQQFHDCGRSALWRTAVESGRSSARLTNEWRKFKAGWEGADRDHFMAHSHTPPLITYSNVVSMPGVT